MDMENKLNLMETHTVKKYTIPVSGKRWWEFWKKEKAVIVQQITEKAVTAQQIPKGWYVSEAGQDPLHLLWFVVLVNLDDVMNNNTNPRYHIMEDCDSFEEALHECIKKCIN